MDGTIHNSSAQVKIIVGLFTGTWKSCFFFLLWKRWQKEGKMHAHQNTGHKRLTDWQTDGEMSFPWTLETEWNFSKLKHCRRCTPSNGRSCACNSCHYTGTSHTQIWRLGKNRRRERHRYFPHREESTVPFLTSFCSVPLVVFQKRPLLLILLWNRNSKRCKMYKMRRRVRDINIPSGVEHVELWGWKMWTVGRDAERQNVARKRKRKVFSPLL